MKKIAFLLAFLVVPALAFAGPCEHFSRPYGVAANINVCLVSSADPKLLLTNATLAGASEVKISKDRGNEANCSYTGGDSSLCMTDEGSCYSIGLTSTEMQAGQIYGTIIDAGSLWLDSCFIIETYGTEAGAAHNTDVPGFNAASCTELSTCVFAPRRD